MFDQSGKALQGSSAGGGKGKHRLLYVQFGGAIHFILRFFTKFVNQKPIAIIALT
ncbi:MAG TPA: hypothetical protein VIO36_11720 [Anaerolineaceae bacterium]